MPFEGRCHCGAVSFAVDDDLPTSALSCNCSHCRAKGLLLAFVPAAQFTLKSGADVLQPYTFNTHKIEHQFCGKCGMQAFAYGVGPEGASVRAINLRSVRSIDLDSLALQKIDGASA